MLVLVWAVVAPPLRAGRAAVATAWQLPPDGDRRPRRVGVFALVLTLLPSGYVYLLVPGFLGLLTVWTLRVLGIVLGARAVRYAREAKHPRGGLFGRAAWLFGAIGLLLDLSACANSCTPQAVSDSIF